MSNLTDREKKLFILDLINNLKQINFKDSSIRVEFSKKIIEYLGLTILDIEEILYQFDYDNKIISIKTHGDKYFVLRCNDNFDNFVKDELGTSVGSYLKEFFKTSNDEKRDVGKYIKHQDIKANENDSDIGMPLYNIEKAPNGAVVINDLISGGYVFLKKPHATSTNDNVLNYLLKNRLSKFFLYFHPSLLQSIYLNATRTLSFVLDPDSL